MGLNEQVAPGGIEWVRVWGRRGYTWNPIQGCTHKCEWTMPDGRNAICYAKTVAEGQIKSGYPGGFENVRFRPEWLDDPGKLNHKAGIFCDSMSDLFGVGTKPEWTDGVLESIAKYPQHIFFGLTKNPPRLVKHDIPANLWTGISAPPTRMFGKEMTRDQQVAWFERGLDFLQGSSARVRWVSLEPLSFDLSESIGKFRKSLDWAVIGAASSPGKRFQPAGEVLSRVLHALEGVPVFFKGNIDKAMAQSVAGRWLNDFPDPLEI